MIRNLFSMHDHRPVNGVTKEQAVQASAWFWRSRNFGVNFASPFSFSGARFESKLGLRQSVSVYVVDEGDNVGVDVMFSAELTDEGAVLGAVGAVVFLPAAAAVGAVSYVEYENDAQRLLGEFWTHLYAFPKDDGAKASKAAAGKASKGGRGAGRTCPGCETKQDGDAKYCKHCGIKL
jgi:hypothetical protein